MGHCVPDWREDLENIFKPIELPFIKHTDVPMMKQTFPAGKEMVNSGLEALPEFGELSGWHEHGGAIESTKGLWSEHMDGDGIAPELRMGALEDEMKRAEQSLAQQQQAKEAHDELESWLQYPADESMDADYCGDGFGALPAQPTGVQAYKDSFASGLTTTRFVRPNPFGHQATQNAPQSSARAANSAAALAEGAARVSGLLPSSLPEALSRVRTQAHSTPWTATPASTGPSAPVRTAHTQEKSAPNVTSPVGGSTGALSPPPLKQQVYPSIFDRSRVAAAATRVGAGTKLKAKELKKAVQSKAELAPKPAPLDAGGNKAAAAEGAQKQSQGLGVSGVSLPASSAQPVAAGQNAAGAHVISQGSGGSQQSMEGAASQGGEQHQPNSPPGKGQNSRTSLQRKESGEVSAVGEPEQNRQLFGGEKSLEERQKELQAELAQRQSQSYQHDMRYWSRGPISPVQLPPDMPHPGFKQIQPKPLETGGVYDFGNGMACYPPQSFMQQHAAAAEAMRMGRHPIEAGPSGQEASVVLSSLTQERGNSMAPGSAIGPSVRAPAWASLMQRGAMAPGPVTSVKRGGRDRSSQGSRALQGENKASMGRDSVNETTVTSSYSEGDSLATSRALTHNPLLVGRKRERCAKSDTEAFDEETDTLTEGTWITEETEGRAAGKGGVKDKVKRSRAAEVHNQSERRRRDRINDRMKALQELIPNSNKTDKASVLDEAIEYLKNLQTQLQFMSMRTGLFAANLPPGLPPSPQAMPGFSLPPMHPPTSHLPPMQSMHPPLGMPPMPFLDHPMFSPGPMMPNEEAGEMKPGRPFGDFRHDPYRGQEHREAGPPMHRRPDMYASYSGQGQPSPQQPSSRFDQGGRQ